MMRASAVRLVLALVLAAPLCPAAVQGQSFVLLTQNVLRFGHGKRLKTQCEAIATAALTADIIVLQEVMKPGYPCIGTNNSKDVDLPLPPGFRYETSGAKGKSSYKEYYGILYRTTVGNNVTIAWDSTADAFVNSDKFMRPPYAVRFRVTDAAAVGGQPCKVWIVNFHAVFGETIGGRRDEAKQMKTVYTTLRGIDPLVIMAGDWNLPANDEAFGWVGAANNATIQPIFATSLTADGVPSSAYDHLVYPSNANPPSVIITPATAYMGTRQGLDWRTNVSDHMGVRANVTLRC
jgi:endonuclease/exonuclease/phosphatase family metal-dependent hydrolase